MNEFELGGADIHTKTSGMVDNATENETDANNQLKCVLSFLPQNVWEIPPYLASEDPIDRADESLLKLVPEKRCRAYDIHGVVKVLADEDSFFEMGSDWGRSLVTGLCRFGGYPVGVLASNPMVIGGALDASASEKQTRFMQLCDTFHIPLVYLVDTPGFLIGEAAEKAGTLRKGRAAVQVMLDATLPIVTVHMRKAFGLAALASANIDKLGLRLCWPSSELGDMPVEGGVAAAFRREIEAADDPAAFEKMVEAQLLEEASPWKTAEAFAVEEMIDPTETHYYLCRFIKAAQGRIRSDLGPKNKFRV